MPEPATRPNFYRYPMLFVAVCFSLGILAGKFAPIDLKVSLIAGVLLAAAALIARKSDLATPLMVLAFTAAGLTCYQAESASVRSDRLKVLYDSGTIRSGSPVEIEGVLNGRPEQSVGGEFLTLRADTISYRGAYRTASGNVRIFVPDSDIPDLRFEISNLKYVSRIRVACKLEREDEFLNPGVLTKREILDRLGVDATATVKSPLLIEHIADESTFLPLAWVYDQRAALINDFRQNLSPSAAGIMIASLLGNKYFLDKNTADLFREGGTFHILVISGLHITFIGGLLLLFLKQFTKNRWLQFGITATVLWAYTLAVGADVPVVRAAIMFTIILFSYAIYRQGTLLNSLGLCALVLLAWRPSDILNPSFQLTFVSVAAIVACAYPLIDNLRKIGNWTPSTSQPFPPNVPLWLKRFCEMLYWNPAAWQIESKRQIWTASLFKAPYLSRLIGSFRSTARYIFEAALVSFIVQLWMMPLVVVYFHRVSVASVLLNLWVEFCIAVESFAAVLGALASHVSSLLGQSFFMFAEVFNWLMLSLPRLFSDNGWASFRLPAYSHAGLSFYLLYFAPILFLAFAVNKWKPFDLKISLWPVRRNVLFSAVAVLIALLAVVVFHPFSAPRPDGRLHIDFLDVGQGDSALVTFPNGETLLVDGGGRVNYRKNDDENETFEPDTRGIGESVVSEFLWDRGYSSINHILATHADADHIEGLNDVAKNFSIGSAIFGRTPMNDLEFAALAAILAKRGVPIETISRGNRFKFGDAIVEALYPVAAADPDSASDNDHSVVLRIVYGNRAFLLTGDIERTAEFELVNGGGTLQADVVKVAHHGSRTSSTQEFIDSIQAKYAVISVGRSSPFGHPHPEVVERWKAAGANVMTTGERGTVSFSTDGRDLELTRFAD